jgi:hypothetical protein
MRNAFVHSNRGNPAKYFAQVANYRALVKSEFNLDALNQFEELSFDDYLLFTRLIKYIAVDVCRIAEPSDADLIKLIEWKGGAIGPPLVRFLSCIQSESLLRQRISYHFRTRYRVDFSNRQQALDDIVRYIKTVPKMK